MVVVEKEAAVGTHQTGHNSGVVHAGLYYPAGSLKARLCRRGVDLLRDYCSEHGLPYEELGKLVVAVDEDELPRLAEIERRSVANQVPGLSRLDRDGIRELEPHVSGVAALHSPHTAVTDFVAVARALADDVVAMGGQVVLGAEVTAIARRGGGAAVETTAGTFVVDRVVLCGGLHSDRLAELAGGAPDPAIVPFRGEYLDLVPDARHLVRGLVYPVPDPSYPFLGVHLTRRINGTVDIGPNAVLALAREGYRRRDVKPAEVVATLRWPGFRSLARQHWRMGLAEFAGSASRRVFVRRAQRYLPALGWGDVVPGTTGVRAQAVAADGSLVDDFQLHELGPVLALRNAPSPAATSSLAIAEYVVDRLATTRR